MHGLLKMSAIFTCVPKMENNLAFTADILFIVIND